MTTTTMPNQRSTMTTTFMLWTCVALVFSASVQGYNRPGGIVEIYPTGSVAVKVGDSLKILCRLGQTLQVCRVEIPGEQSMILTPDQGALDGISYYGNGTKSGQCGAQIDRIKESHDGEFKCWLTTSDSRSENSASLRIIVAKPPHNPEIYLSPGSNGDNRYRPGDKLEIGCVARSGRPAANVSLFLDDEPIGYEGRALSYDSNSVKDNNLAVQNATRTIDWTDNGKIVRCVAHHIALSEPKESKRELQVSFSPQPQASNQRFGYVIGRPGIVNITVHANPRPSFLWKIDGVEIPEGRSDSDNRLQTSTAVDLGRGAWGVELRIDSVQKSDTEKKYVLEARNGEGAFEYPIGISTAAEPAGVDLDAGSIIGIAVGILVLVLVVFLIIFARATGRWCFAARRRGDEETAGAAGAGSEAHITPGDGDEEDEDPHIMDEKLPHGGQENPIHASTEYVNGRTDIKDMQRKDEKVDTPV